MLFTSEPSAVMTRCRRAFQQGNRPAEPQVQVIPIRMPAMERMRKYRELAKRPAVRSGAASINVEPGGTMRGSPVYEQAKRVRAQRLQHIREEGSDGEVSEL